MLRRRPRSFASLRTAFSVCLAASVLTVSAGAVSAAPQPAAVKASGDVYVVKAGDNVYRIAINHRVALDDLLELNGLRASSVIVPGDRLKIPAGGTRPAPNAPAKPTTPAKPTAPAKPAAALTYTVRSGDFLIGIAASMRVSVGALLSTNSLTLTSRIMPGDVLKVPAGGRAPSTAPTPATPSTPSVPAGNGQRSYTIKAGDFLFDIAAKHGVTLAALLSANQLIVSSTILPGQTLIVPAATLPIPPAKPSSNDNGAVPRQNTLAPMLAFLRDQIGKPYRFAAAGPDAYDCSGLVRAAYLQIGIDLPHQSMLQSRLGEAVDWRTEDLQPGDLVFSYSSGKTYVSHVGVAISSTQWIQASRAGIPVKISALPSDDVIKVVRRIVP